MRSGIVLGLAGLLAVPAAWAGDEKDKKDGNGKAFKVEGKLTADDPRDKVVGSAKLEPREYRRPCHLPAGSNLKSFGPEWKPVNGTTLRMYVTLNHGFTTKIVF